MKKYKCIIFDCDGVLVDSETLSNQVMVDMANEHEANIDLNFALRNFKGGVLKDCIQQIERLIGRSLPENFDAEYRRRSFAVFQKDLKPIQGVEKVLRNLKIPFCTASSGPQEKIILNLKTTRLLSYFEENIFSCYDIQKWKPDPAIFLHAAAIMDFKPENCLVIEDTSIGVKAAKAGGFDVFGFAANDSQETFENLATKIFYTMEELSPMISSNQ